MLRSLSRLQAALLGLVVLAGLGSMVVGLFAVGGQYWPWNNVFHVRAGFPQVHGVEVGTRVRVQGIDAGEVEAIRPPLEPGGNVVLVLRLKGDLRRLVRTDAVAQIVSEGMVGGKVIEINPGRSAEPVADNDTIASRPSTELSDVLNQVGATLQGFQQSEGTLAKLLKDPEAYQALLGLMKQSEKTMAAMQQDAEAMKKVPVLGGYVEDPQALLVRPNCERNRWIFPEADLFEPGRAVLTAQGRQKLDELAPKLSGMVKHPGAELVVASYADLQVAGSPEAALTLTRQQSEAVVKYLKDRYGVHKLDGLQGWLYSRKVTPLGMGTRTSPTPEKDKLPASRIEVLVFVPQG